jgi:hypothetical protein
MSENKNTGILLTTQDLPVVEAATADIIGSITNFVLDYAGTDKLPEICITAMINSLYHVLTVLGMTKENSFKCIEDIWDKQELLKKNKNVEAIPNMPKPVGVN